MQSRGNPGLGKVFHACRLAAVASVALVAGCGSGREDAGPTADEVYAALTCPGDLAAAQDLQCPSGEVVLCCPDGQGVRKVRFEITGEGRDYTVDRVEGTLSGLRFSFAPFGDGDFQRNRVARFELNAADALGLAVLASPVPCLGFESGFDDTVAQGPPVTASNGRWTRVADGQSLWFELTEVVRYTPQTSMGAPADAPRLGSVSGCVGIEVGP